MSFLSISLTIHDDTRGGIVGEIWERGDWGGGQIQVSNVHSFTFTNYDVPDKKCVLDGFFYFLNCFSP